MTPPATIHVVDDDDAVRDSLRLLFESVGLHVETHESPREFLDQVNPGTPGCVVLDLRMPEVNGMEILTRFRERAVATPVIVVTGFGEVGTAVRAMKLGAVEFLEKPVDDEILLEAVQHWTEVGKELQICHTRCSVIRARLKLLSPREREVLEYVLEGCSNKEIARHLGIGPKAVELYRSKLMGKMEVSTAVSLTREVLMCPAWAACPLICSHSAFCIDPATYDLSASRRDTRRRA